MQSSGGWYDLVFSNVDANASVQVLASFADGLFDRGKLKGHLTRIYFSSTLNFTSGLYSKFMVHRLRSEEIITSYGILNILPKGKLAAEDFSYLVKTMSCYEFPSEKHIYIAGTLNEHKP